MMPIKQSGSNRNNLFQNRKKTDFIKPGTLAGFVIMVSIILTVPCATAGESNPSKQGDSPPDYSRTSVSGFSIPDVEVIRMDGEKLPFIKELDDGQPVIMNFIFASCSAVCPMLSHVFMQIQKQLAKDKGHVHLVSISIDPESDTPTVLKAYAKKFNAGKGWDFYTGKLETIIALQKAFNVYRGDKMNHSSTTLLRAKPGASWVRLEGFASPADVMDEYRRMMLGNQNNP